MLVFLLVYGALLAHAKRHSTLRDYPWGPPNNIEPKPIVLSTTHPTTTEIPIHIWPLGRIPYVDDPALIEDEDQAVALNNARMDLQVRTCIKFVKRRNEQDYVFFTDLGLDTEPACLSPMKWPYKPKQVFSDCDIEYVNHLYRCPRPRRKQSPICPAGHTIMSLPEMPNGSCGEEESEEKRVSRPKKLRGSNKKQSRGQNQCSTKRAKKKFTNYRPHHWPYIERGGEHLEHIRRPFTLVTPGIVRSRGRHTTTYPMSPYISEQLVNTPPTPPQTTTLSTTITTTTESTTTTVITTTSPSTTITTTTPSTTSSSTTTTQAPTTTTPLPEPETTTTDFPDFTDDENTNNNPQPMHTKSMITNSKSQVITNKKHININHKSNRTHEFTTSSSWHGGPPKNGKIGKEKMMTKYVGSCGSPCNYTGGLTPLRRSYNDKIGITDHFYTTDIQEQQTKIKDGYLLQSPMGFLGQTSVDPRCTCLKPLYRLYNEFLKDHLLTTTEHEKEMAERILGYKFEKALGFCTKEAGCGAYVPLYRFYNPIAKDHLYTIDEQEMSYYKNHPEHAYSYEYIECYVWQSNSNDRVCPLRDLMSNAAEIEIKEFYD